MPLSPLDPKQAVQSLMAGTVPKSEAVGGTPGSTGLIPDAGHQHPRLSSASTATITSGSTATIMFTRVFDKQPSLIPTLIEAPTANQQPCLFAVVDWLNPQGETLGTNPADGVVIGGCVVKAWRATPVPQNLVSLLVGGVFSLFQATVVGVRFSYIAVASSQT